MRNAIERGFILGGGEPFRLEWLQDLLETVAVVTAHHHRSSPGVLVRVGGGLRSPAIWSTKRVRRSTRTVSSSESRNPSSGLFPWASGSCVFVSMPPDQAVVHYDLAWNPTRHEQREGRVDRAGSKVESHHLGRILFCERGDDGVAAVLDERFGDARTKAFANEAMIVRDYSTYTLAPHTDAPAKVLSFGKDPYTQTRYRFT